MPSPPAEPAPAGGPSPDRIADLFHQAFDMDVSARGAFLEQACSGDGALREFVERLLASSGEADSSPRWREPAILKVARASAETAHPMLDRYRLVERLGAGGMGVVYKAVRSDDAFSKEVAIKIVQWAAGNEAALGRFRAERQILARLEHPNIARLLDGGATAEGMPFLVMELVEGVPIDEYVAQQKPALRDLLLLFRRICAAVSYAHRNLVVHRDLKPGNILVARAGPDGIPEPKLLDFGIARLLDGSQELTRTRAMTMEYASPEQVSGAPISTASDIYSLGVLLYELVAGTRPYRPTTSPMDLAGAICKEDPLPLQASVNADLANIILMALRKEPGRRYASVEQFSEDLRRFLEGYPVAARPDTRTYRARKFVGRNKLPMAAAALILLTLAGGIAATVRQARIATRRFNDVRKLANSYLYEVYDGITMLPGATNVRKLVVNRALEYLDSLSRERSGDRALTRELATAYLRVGNLQGLPDEPNLGDTQGALASYRKSLALAEELMAGDPKDAESAMRAAEDHAALCKILMLGGDLKSSLQHGRKALAIMERIAPSLPAARDLLPGAYAMVANVEGNPNFPNLGNTRMAMDLYEKAMAKQRENTAAHPGDTVHRLRLSNYYGVIGQMYQAMNDGPRAVDAMRHSLEIDEALVKEEPSNAYSKQSLAVTCNNLAFAYVRALNDVASARPLSDRATQLYAELVESDPDNVEALLALAASYLTRGLVRRNEPAEQLAACDKGIALYESAMKRRSGGILPPSFRSLYQLRADALTALGQFSKAIASAQKELEIDDHLLKASSADAGAQRNQGVAWSQIGKVHMALAARAGNSASRLEEWRQAREWYQRSYDIFDGQKKRGKLIPIYQSNLDAARSAVAACDRALADAR